MSDDDRLRDARRFYALIEELERRQRRRPLYAPGRDLPERGVYFVFEDGEIRTDTGEGPRVVRVGTHALQAHFKRNLAGRLADHRRRNHRGSVFRLHVGMAMLRRDPNAWPEEVHASWSVGTSAPADVRERERGLEEAVSAYMARAMTVLCLPVPDPPGPLSARAFVERGSVALLSNWRAGEAPVDPPGEAWLGRFSARAHVRRSGLWDVDFTDVPYDPAFLDVMADLVERAERA